MEAFCREAGYEARFVPGGFLPKTAEERLLLAPPEHNLDVSNWQDVDESAAVNPSASEADPIRSQDPELEAFRRQLEGLL
jgi:protein involved in sex pheromone biosynthesis